MVPGSQIMTHVVVTLMLDQRAGLHRDILAGINKRRRPYYRESGARYDYLHQPLDAQQISPTSSRVKGHQQENKPASFSLCSCVCVCFFPASAALLHFHSRFHYFQLISFYKARPLHNYPLSIRSHPVRHCRLRPC